MAMSNDYDAFPGHPLAGIDPAILACARAEMQEVADAGDIAREMVEPVADAIVLALRMAGFLR